MCRFAEAGADAANVRRAGPCAGNTSKLVLAAACRTVIMSVVRGGRRRRQSRILEPGLGEPEQCVSLRSAFAEQAVYSLSDLFNLRPARWKPLCRKRRHRMISKTRGIEQLCCAARKSRGLGSKRHQHCSGLPSCDRDVQDSGL